MPHSPLAPLAAVNVADLHREGFLSREATVSLREIKSITGAPAGSPGATYPVAEQRLPGIAGDVRRSLSIFDVFRHRTVTSNSYEYLRVAANSDAAVVAEGELKPAADDISFTQHTGTVVTIATTVAISEQLISDVPELTGFLQSLLGYHCLQHFEQQCVVGSSSSIEGLNEAAITYTPTLHDNIADAIGETAATMRAEGWNADVVLLHPLDEFRLATVKTVGGYLAGVFVQSAPQLFGLRQVTSASVPQGTAFVADSSRAATIVDRQSVTASYGTVDAQFTQNLRTLRVEMRGSFYVGAPRAVRKVSL